MASCQRQPGHHLVRWPTENADSDSAGEATWRQRHLRSGGRGGIKGLGPQRKDFSYGNCSTHLARCAACAAGRILSRRANRSRAPLGPENGDRQQRENKKMILSTRRRSPGARSLFLARRPPFCRSGAETPSSPTWASKQLARPHVCFLWELRESPDVKLVRRRAWCRQNLGNK